MRTQDEDGAADAVAEHVRNAGQHMMERMLAARPIPAADAVELSDY